MNTIILQLLVSGLAMGFIYALVGIEYTLIWNSTGLLNFSHDKLITLGAYIFGASMVLQYGLSKPLAILVTFVVMFLLGCLVALGIFNPLRNMRSNIFAVMGTIILGRIIAEFIRLYWGPVPFTVPDWLTGTFNFGGFIVTRANVIICGVSALVVITLQCFLTFTKTGKAMRCVAQNKKAATLMGINVSQNICITTGISAIICSTIGFLTIPLFTISTTMAATIGLKGFSAGVIGGFGYIPGVIVGGIFIGIVENLAVAVLPAVYKDVVSFALLILFLLVKPSGFLGKRA
ncbi:MAG TPA: branched-chain amino acid ABC transporter permease [Candidatus Egerieimonas intestinavium]|mgnify:CR=1 FL=1|uniref:Branched-chain amino acid ABC transporter permease n=1 Tax=Candidatus Egerieimonas intestinavium TaxID=2840777 RepID=A0A9D1EID8_9FIRM|nr:branched-chain amino acid ABC transporter permease [Candidatus Egerieimonas intestinavium]